MHRSVQRVLSLVLALSLLLTAFAPALAQEGASPDAPAASNVYLPFVGGSQQGAQGAGLPDRGARPLPAAAQAARLDAPVSLDGVDRSFIDGAFAAGPNNRYIVVLKGAPVSRQGARGNSAVAAKQQVEAEQQALVSRIKGVAPGARVLGQVQVVMNAVFVQVDPAAVPAIASDPAVQRVAPVGTYELDLSESVPYIGGTAAQGMGYTGKGVRVAVLDSGIDYTHAALGGSGNVADFNDNDPTIIEAGSFPTTKVVGGFDFVGEAWTGGAGSPPETPDADPLDKGTGAGHGTHVADIIGGKLGVAPDADLYAVKVCSSVSTSCSGLALIQGMEFATDPDGDGDPSDAVDVINMSLGSPYGQPFDDDLSMAVENATALGVLTVASAGNSGDKPYAAGTPSSASSALAVAQTAMPKAELPLMEVVSPAGIAGLYPAVFQPWSAPLTGRIQGPLQYGDGAGGNLLGCDPFTPDSLAGKIVLVDRGVCGFSIKIANIAAGGALAGIIGLVAPGDPFEGGYGGGDPSVPGFMISQALSNRLKGGLAAGEVIVAFDEDNGLPLAGSVVGSSSRGPRNSNDNIAKPEIGAPGASVSAIYGTGTGTGPFGGTSGAAPMVTGSAALLLQAAPQLSPLEAKARLMNTAETQILNDVLLGTLAPISRIGGGEVRVDRAVSTPVAAWDDAFPSATLNFGLVDVDKDVVTLHKTVRVRNYSNKAVEYVIEPTFRFADDAALGAVSVQAPSKVKVNAGKDATFTVKLTINGAKLLGNAMNSGSLGANPAPLTLNEIDGYILLKGENPVHLAWHVLPRKAANVVGRQVLNFSKNPDVVSLNNIGMGIAQNDAYALLAVSPNIPSGPMGGQSPTPDLRAVGVNTFPVAAGFCSDEPSFLWAFAVNTWERQAHLLPVSHQLWLDTNRDGTDDYLVLNRDVSLNNLTDGRQLTWVVDLATGDADAWFFAEHSTNTGNTVLYLCAEQIGMTQADMLATNVDVDVIAQDFYFGGPGDLIEGITVTPLGERFYGVPQDIGPKSKGTLQVVDFGLFPGNTPELGVMLVTNGDRGAGNRGGATQATEALLFQAK